MRIDRLKQIIKIAAMLIIVATFVPCGELSAVPAKPNIIKVTQPDGSQIEIVIRGDEFFKWRTTESGYPITKGEDGYYYYAQYSSSGAATATSQRVSVEGVMQSPPSGVTSESVSSIAQSASSAARIARQGVVSRSGDSSSGFPSQGDIKSAVILVEYADVKFSIDDPNQAFYNQLNQEGYSVEGATGSARDYFSANSKGAFNGQFDVYGPYTLSNDRSYYGGNSDVDGFDVLPDEMVAEAAQLADAAGVDFSQYDLDEDGYIDNVFVYYAGLNEAESEIEDSVWPHKWVVASKPTFDGKKLYVYACTSELRGAQGTTIAGIGTFCHEFSHVFGLADHYDTDGDTNGESYGTGCYDIMCYGSYNNDGNTPPMMNGLELFMIGWETPTILSTSQELTIDPIGRGNVYMVKTDVEDEFFLIENHYQNDNVWDSYIEADGLFITHVDMSSNYLYKWNQNNPNGDTSHECFRYIVAGNTTLSWRTESQVPYPYRTNNEWSATSKPAAQSWSGADLGVNITDIVQNSDGSISMTVVSMQDLSGVVTNEDGDTVANASITFTDTSDNKSYQTTTDEQGEYSMELPIGSYEVDITCAYYQDYYDVVSVAGGSSTINFTLSSYSITDASIEIIAEQTQAKINWNTGSYLKFRVSINDTVVATVEDSQYTATGLTPATTYTVTISAEADQDSYEPICSDSFTTIAKLTDIPLLNLTQYNYSAGDLLEVKMLNTESDDTVSYFVDGVALTSNKVTLTAGEHTIQAVVVRGSESYRTTKVINVE